MDPPKVSLVMAAYNRKEQARHSLDSIYHQRYPDIDVVFVDDGSTDGTEELAGLYPIRYIRIKNRGWNVARTFNVGIRAAKHDILIMQGAEVRHLTDVILKLARASEADEKAWILANVRTHDGVDYCSSSHLRPCAFFLSCLRRKWLMEIRGFDEEYILPGHDDDDLAFRLITHIGLAQRCDDTIRGEHQWHEPAPFTSANGQMYTEKCANGGAVRNLGKEWGEI